MSGPDETVCMVCRMPLLVQRADNIPICANCDGGYRHTVEKIQKRKKAKRKAPMGQKFFVMKKNTKIVMPQ